MTLRVVLHTGHDHEPGVEAWAIDYLGLATWADSREEVLDKLPSKFEEHLMHLELNGLPATRATGGIEIVEEVDGDEVLFGHDRQAAGVDEIETTLRLLEWTRRDLLTTIAHLPDEVLDWDPPYRNFPSWADWRTVRAILWHVANAESHYYLEKIGVRPTMRRATSADDWHAFLPRSRTHTIAALHALKASNDRLRLTEDGESWSVRKSLRRIVRHEIMHTRSIRRIVRAYENSDE